MTTSNPTLSAFDKVGAMGVSYGANDTMTVEGTINKTGILGAILTLCFVFTWSGLSHLEGQTPNYTPVVIGAIGGLILALIIVFKPTTAPYLSPVYAAVEGVLMAAVSYPLELMYPHIVLQAAGLTLATLFGMLIAYKTKLIVVNNTFRAVVVVATLSIFVFYIIAMVCSFFGIMLPGISFQDTSLFSIGISVVIVIVAALNLALDFDMISTNAGSAPKYMEWYGAFSLLVTLVWLYFELLRLLAKLRGRD